MDILGVVSAIADFVGILGAGISVVLWYKTDRIRDEIKHQNAVYTKTRTQIIGRLYGIQNSIVEDKITGLRVRSDLRIELLACKRNFKNILSLRDKHNINCAINILKTGDNLDIEKLTAYTDPVIARFMRIDMEVRSHDSGKGNSISQ